jgi:hypothetical protein
MTNFQHPSTKISIASTDAGYTGLMVEAQYNPKELQIDKSVPWQKNPQANKSPEKGIQLEFTGAEGRTMSVELLFDGYEDNKPIADKVEILNTLASPLVAGDLDENKRRPHLCVVAWGAFPGFRCVIESLSTKYTMFSPAGVPLRATCTVKLKEANVVAMAKADGSGGGTTAPAGGSTTK